MGAKLTNVAFVYDFDGTLAPGNMQEHKFFPKIQKSPKAFWDEAKERAKSNDMDEILAYMELMLEKSIAANHPMRFETFRSYGELLPLFAGVEDWFGRQNQRAKRLKVRLKHFVISSGLREMIGGSAIAGSFETVFASGFRYDQNGVAKWPALAVNYTTKTQFLFRINKGIGNAYDNDTINKFTPMESRPIPFENIVYFGDGDTDVPAMKITTSLGGRAIAVYRPRRKGAKNRCSKLISDGRATCMAPADYRANHQIDRIADAFLKEVAARRAFRVAANIRFARQ